MKLRKTMHNRENLRFQPSFKWVIAGYFVLHSALAPQSFSAPANSQDPLLTNLQVGNIVLSQSGMATLVRAALAKAHHGTVEGDTVTFQFGKKEFKISKPKTTGDLTQILSILGLDQMLGLNVGKLSAKAILPVSTFKFKATPIQNNTFRTQIEWSTPSMQVLAAHNSLWVPAGLFEKGFQLDLDQATLTSSGSTPLRLNISGIVKVSTSGATFALETIHSNFPDTLSPQLTLKTGQLSVAGKPFVLQFESPHMSIYADSESIQAAIRENNEYFTRQIKKAMAEALVSLPAKMNASLSEQLKKSPIQAKLAIGTLSKDPKSALNQIAGDGVLTIYPTYVQSSVRNTSGEPQTSLQFGSKFQLGSNAVQIKEKPVPFKSEELALITPEADYSILLHESWIKNIVKNEIIQSRFKTWYSSNNKSNGVRISEHGVGVHLNPKKDSVVIVLNLAIDIADTGKPGSTWLQKLKRKFGDLIETWFGSGKEVKVPIEITARIQGIQPTENGNHELLLKAELPFYSDNSGLLNTYGYPTNLDKMTKFVRGDFLESLKEDVAEAVPSTIRIPIKKITLFDLIELKPRSLQITPNHGLLVNTRGDVL